MDKVGVTLLLRGCGVRLSEAYDAADGILEGRAMAVELPAGADEKAVREQLEKLGVLV